MLTRREKEDRQIGERPVTRAHMQWWICLPGSLGISISDVTCCRHLSALGSERLLGCGIRPSHAGDKRHGRGCERVLCSRTLTLCALALHGASRRLKIHEIQFLRLPLRLRRANRSNGRESHPWAMFVASGCARHDPCTRSTDPISFVPLPFPTCSSGTSRVSF